MKITKGTPQNLINHIENILDQNQDIYSASRVPSMRKVYIVKDSGMGEIGDKYTQDELYEFFEQNASGDPCMEYYLQYTDEDGDLYPAFEAWLHDTVNNGYLSGPKLVSGDSIESTTDTGKEYDVFMLMDYECGYEGMESDCFSCLCKFFAKDMNDAERQFEECERKYSDKLGAKFMDGLYVSEYNQYFDEWYGEDAAADPYNPDFNAYPDLNTWFAQAANNFNDFQNYYGEEPPFASTRINASELSDDELDKLYEIADRYTTSKPLSGDWNTEVEHEQQAIADELNVSLQQAKDMMINKLGFDADDFVANVDIKSSEDFDEYEDDIKEI